MLENYFSNGGFATDDKKKRLLAVQAALEIAKAGASSNGSVHALDALNSGLEKAADAIQAALEKK